MSPRRATPAAGVLTVVLAAALTVLLPAPAAEAAEDPPTIRATISSVSPTELTDSGTVTVAGSVTNSGDEPWTDVQAYLVIRREPFTDRAALARAVEEEPSYAGERVVEVGRFDEVGTLPAGSTRPFSVSLPADELPISRADGVYPVGVQILATDADGARSNDSVARAVTVLPHMTRDHPAAPSTVIWPFLMPTERTGGGEIVEPDALLKRISPDGQLGQLLDLATARSSDGQGVIVDPALVVAADDLARGRAGSDLSDDDRDVAGQFRDDLVAAGSGASAWTLDYDRTDVLALAGGTDQHRRLAAVVERATESVILQYGLSRERVSWPTQGGVDRALLASLRSRGGSPAVISSQDLPAWESSSGSMIDYPTANGNLPVLVSDDITRGLPGTVTPAVLRQRVLATAALASLSREAGSDSAASAVTVVNPTWNPGGGPAEDPRRDLDESWSSDFTRSTDLQDIALDGTYAGEVTGSATARPLDDAQIAAAAAAARSGAVINAAGDGDDDDAFFRDVANTLGVRWRDDRSGGLAAARDLSDSVERSLQSITVMGPTAVTLSSSAGSFPLTISNDTGRTISVGVRLSSSNPALSIPDQDVVQIAAGERLTTTVDVDLRQQNATTVTAQLLTPDGRPFGATSQFNVRSSRVGAVLWATMGAAGLFVLLALARRFRRRTLHRPATTTIADDD